MPYIQNMMIKLLFLCWPVLSARNDCLNKVMWCRCHKIVGVESSDQLIFKVPKFIDSFIIIPSNIRYHELQKENSMKASVQCCHIWCYQNVETHLRNSKFKQKFTSLFSLPTPFDHNSYLGSKMTLSTLFFDACLGI